MHRAVCLLSLSIFLIQPVFADTVALWLFDEPVGSSAAFDSSGHGFHLTIGPDAAIVAEGQFGNCLNADALPEDGLGAYRFHAESELNPGDQDWTLECWMKAKPGMSKDNRIWGLSGVNYIDYTVGDQKTLRVATRFLPVDGPKGFALQTGDLLADIRFHHLAVVYDSARKELRQYFDGKLVTTSSGAWKEVVTGKTLGIPAVYPPFYPMLQIGMRDAFQQWNHQELNQSERLMKKFEGYLDEMRFSNTVVYSTDFTPPASFATGNLCVLPDRISMVSMSASQQPAQAKVTLYTSKAETNWVVEEDLPWLEVSPASGKTTPEGAEVILTVLKESIPVGKQEGRIRFSSPQNPSNSIEVPVVHTGLDESQVLQVGDRKQLFIDHRFIEKGTNYSLQINQAQKVPIQFAALNEFPIYPAAILYDEERQVYRMYYSAFNGMCMRMVVSTDGITWNRPPDDFPPYGIEPREGNPDQLLPLPFQSSFLYDTQAPPEQCYKAFAERRDDSNPANTGVYAYISKDGYRFKEVGKVLNLLPEGGAYPAWDPRLKQYVVYMRVQNIKSPLKMIQGNQFFYKPGFSYDKPDGFVERVEPESMLIPGLENLRSIGRIVTSDLLKSWPVKITSAWDPQYNQYATTLDIEPVLVADATDGFCDFYTSPVMIYPFAEDVYFSFPSVFRHLHPSRQPWFYRFADANGPIEIQLALSRDGIHWNRPVRKAYVDTGMTDEWDRWLNMIGHSFIRKGGWLYQYYWSSGRLHDSLFLRPELGNKIPAEPPLGLAVARQRLDGYVSVDVDHGGGELTTPVLYFEGDRLFINQNSGATGTIFVEIQDVNGNPIPGYSLADCEEITGNDVDWEVRWQGSPVIRNLARKPVRLHFRMTATKLYAFQFRKT